MSLGSLGILLLGSYHPTEEKLKEMYEKGEPSIKNKLKNNKPLHYLEKLNYLKEKLTAEGHDAYSVRDKKTEIRNVWKRTKDLMNESEIIIHLLTNSGGSILEHGMITILGLHYKTFTFIARKEYKSITGMITKGTRLLPNVQMYIYENDKDLLDLVERKIDDYLREKFVKELKKKLETEE